MRERTWIKTGYPEFDFFYPRIKSFLEQDVLDVVLDVMRHRLVLSYEALSDAVTSDAILHRILDHIPAPAAPMEEHVEVVKES